MARIEFDPDDIKPIFEIAPTLRVSNALIQEIRRIPRTIGFFLVLGNYRVIAVLAF